MEQKKLSELQANDSFEGFVLVRSFSVKTGQTGKNYADLVIADAQSELNGKIWNYNEDQFKNFKPHVLIKVRGTVVAWMNSLQLKIEKIRLATEEDPVSINDFVPSAPKTAEDMFDVIKEYINRINKKDIRDIVTYAVKLRKEKLLYYPAAQANHHSVRSGLLYHTTSMLKVGEMLSSIYSVNTSILFAGIILHDIGKIVYPLNPIQKGVMVLLDKVTKGSIKRCSQSQAWSLL